MTREEAASIIIKQWLEYFKEHTGESELIVAVEPISFKGCLMSELYVYQKVTKGGTTYHASIGVHRHNHWEGVSGDKLPRVVAECSTDVEAYLTRVGQNDEIFDELQDNLPSGRSDVLWSPSTDTASPPIPW